MSTFVIKAKKIMTVSKKGTIEHGAMVVQNGKIIHISTWENVKQKYHQVPVIDYGEHIISPSLVDCHTHLLEFAPPSKFPITKETHLLAGKSILLEALCSGITALGEQVCGNPICELRVPDIKQAVQDVPMDICFAAASISVGFQKIIHFTAITGSTPIPREYLVNKDLIKALAAANDYAGGNIFINATPGNFLKHEVPNAGKLIHSQQELTDIVSSFHGYGTKIGANAAGEQGIQMALEAGFDVLHHAHGITDRQIEKAAKQKIMVVATPLGGSHLEPNSFTEIMKMIHAKIPLSISTGAFLPPYEKNAVALTDDRKRLIGPEALMAIANPFMTGMLEHGYSENEALALITRNPAKVLGKENRFGSLEEGKEANLLISEGIPGIELINPNKIKAVYFRGEKVVARL
ncbi:amidohydrolase family protein [Bacillus tuaregi]|uniref:amidohydrolase family protein n=1 Tax=Bacillus tuaregi TaxID=1816695 RepID=UPI0008F954EA|nr:amidohydrolase family protein [Bacillus tuaregi]